MAFTMEFGTGFEMGRLPIRAGSFYWSGSPFISTSGVSLTSARTGSYCVRLGTSTLVRMVRPSPSDEVYVSAWIQPNNYAKERSRIELWLDDDTYITLRHDFTYWNAYVGDVLVASGAVATSVDVWQHVQIRVLLGGAGVGLIETVVDGISDIAYSGDTAGGASQITEVAVRSQGVGVTTYLDDICFGEGGWPGDVRFDPVYVSSDVQDDWEVEPALSDHYAVVDEVPPDSDDFVYTQIDASDRYGTPGTWDDTDGSGNVVKDPIAVTVWVDVRKQDGNTDDKVRLAIGDGVNTVTGEYESLLTSYENRWFTRLKAPDGGEWTKAKINALILGIDAQMAEV